MKKILYKTLWLSCLAMTGLGANTFTDKDTNLMWQDNSEVKTNNNKWDGAIEYCKNLRLGGYSDWRLPNIDELLGITDDKKYNPAIKLGFKNVASDSSDDYWSSSPSVSNSSDAWLVNFNYGGGSTKYKSSSYDSLVRCVRDSKDTLNLETFNQKVEKIIKQFLSTLPKPPANIELVKGEFESTSEFEVRVKETKIKQAKEIQEYETALIETKKLFEKPVIRIALAIVWGKPLLENIKYDADNGYFVADLRFEGKREFNKKVAIKVERENAKSFKDGFATLKPQAIFEYDGGSVSLKDIKIPHKEATYTAQFTDMKISDTKVAVNLSNDFKSDFGGVSTNINVGATAVSSLDTSKLQDFQELDRLLESAVVLAPNKKKWLFVIGIEKYDATDNIEYATRSAEMFAKIGIKKLGIPKENSFVLLNNEATQAKIKTNLQRMLARVKEGDEVYFYYNGHGVPVANQNFEPFMLAKDSEPDYIGDEKFFALNNIYGSLSGSKAGKVVAFVDSCFSGVTDGKAVLKGVAATKMTPKIINFDKEKMVVITAGKGHQYSNGYNKKGHRMFSFFAMKNILESDEKTINNLFKNIKNETYEASVEEYGDGRTQEPTIEGNANLGL